MSAIPTTRFYKNKGSGAKRAASASSSPGLPLTNYNSLAFNNSKRAKAASTAHVEGQRIRGAKRSSASHATRRSALQTNATSGDEEVPELTTTQQSDRGAPSKVGQHLDEDTASDVSSTQHGSVASAAPNDVRGEPHKSTDRKDINTTAEWRWAGPATDPPGHGAVLTQEESTMLDLGAARFFEAARLRKTKIALGDAVLLRAAESTLPYVARLIRLFEDASSLEKFVTIKWFLRPEETRQGRQPQHGQDELLTMGPSAAPRTFSMDCIESPCTVLSFGSYCRYRAECSRLRALGENNTTPFPVFFIKDKGQPLRRSRGRRTRRTRSQALGTAALRRTKRHQQSSSASQYARRQPTALVATSEASSQAGSAASSSDAARAASASEETNKVNRRNNKGETKLHVAAGRGDLGAVEALLAQGATVDVQDNAGWTPLHEACAAGHADVTGCLLRHGASPRVIGPEGVTPLHDAAEMGFRKVAELLIEYGADKEASTDTGETPLELAADDDMVTVINNTKANRRSAVAAN